jgi:toxin CptA
MIDHTQRAPLLVRPGFSRRLAVFVCVTHAAALAVSVVVPLAWYWRPGLVMAILGSLVYQIRLHLLHRAARAVRHAEWAADGTWTLMLGSGREVEGTLAPATFVGTSLVALNFRCGRWRRCALVLLPDNVDPTLLRRLRVRLRLTGGSGAAATAIQP